LKIIGARHPLVFAFVGDITLAVDPKDLDDAYATVAEAVRHVRLRLNEAKCKSSTPGSLNDETFPILGGDLHETRSFVDSYLKKMDRWFDRLARVQVHPALHFTLLRISGSAKIRYITQILRPEYVRPIAVRFNELVYATLENILGVRPTPPAVHDVHGAGIPDYASNLHNLYDTSKREAETGFITHLPKLVTNCFEDKAAGENDVQDLERPTGDPHQGDYLFYKHGAINPAHFVTALAIRLGCLPPSMQWCTPTTCACGSYIKDVRQVCRHVITCPLTPISHTYRHNLVRDTMAKTARQYGITCIVEPTIYTYDNGLAQRPDIVFMTKTPVACDVSIVAPCDYAKTAMTRATKEKSTKHERACAAIGHEFIPAICESTGLMSDNIYTIGRKLAGNVPFQLSKSFEKQFIHGITSALATGRAETIMAWTNIVLRKTTGSSSNSSANGNRRTSTEENVWR
jgi:hypothetical protein